MEEGAPLLPEPTTTTSRPRWSLILVALGVGSAALAGVLALSHVRSSAAQTVAGTFALARADAAVPTPPPTMPCIKNGDDDIQPVRLNDVFHIGNQVTHYSHEPYRFKFMIYCKKGGRYAGRKRLVYLARPCVPSADGAKVAHDIEKGVAPFCSSP